MSKLVIAFTNALLARKSEISLTEEVAEKIGEEAYRLAGAAYRGTKGKKRKKSAVGERDRSADLHRKKGNRRREGEADRRRQHDARQENATHGR
jgi:hypothetical protein